MTRYRTALFTIAALVCGSVLAQLPEITHLRINPTPPGAKVGVAYLKLHNPSDETLILSAISSPSISQIEIHLSQRVKDVASMHKQDFIEIPANQSVLFKHGGYHLMLMGLEAPLMPGTLIPLVFHTNQGDISTETRVSETIEVPTDNHGDMSHGQMGHSNKQQ